MAHVINGQFMLTSPDFKNNDQLPKQFTCDGAGTAPRLRWSGAPEGTQSFALIVDDPDAPKGTYVHWVVYNIPAELTESNFIDALQGTNSADKRGYVGACPPPGHGVHHYHFKLYALDAMLSLQAGATKHQLLDAMKKHLLGQTELMGTYKRD